MAGRRDRRPACEGASSSPLEGLAVDDALRGGRVRRLFGEQRRLMGHRLEIESLDVWLADPHEIQRNPYMSGKLAPTIQDLQAHTSLRLHQDHRKSPLIARLLTSRLHEHCTVYAIRLARWNIFARCSTEHNTEARYGMVAGTACTGQLAMPHRAVPE